jgi:hypothetical protein
LAVTAGKTLQQNLKMASIGEEITRKLFCAVAKKTVF